MSVEKIASTQCMLATTSAAHPYAQLVAMKRWADHGLYEAADRNLGKLSPQDAFLMRRVLDHMHAVDRIFQHHLQGLPHTFRAARSEALPEIAALASGTREVNDWYVAYVDSLAATDADEPIDFIFTSGKPARMTRGEIILHVCLHGSYHRGNAGALLQLRDITPSRDGITDFFEAEPSRAHAY
ncbi:DinB family protein [Variovorax sp. LT1R20]|uniref:DinB family protein n=1 Tax=Variovorax sp. LT1R20 TaxID=3443729 RepID=UPI003F462BE5